MDALAILDATAHCLIHRTYTHELRALPELIRAFALAKQTTDRPVLQVDGVNYCYITNNDLILLCVVYHDHVNAMTVFSFLYKLDEILMSYFQSRTLHRDMITDNFNLIYELFDECCDYGVPQLTDVPILKDVIKLEVQQNEEVPLADDDGDVVNSSILKTTTNSVSWRPRGIFYKKNELFVDITERVAVCVDVHNKVIRHEIHGSIDLKCYLSGMPVLKLGLNKLINDDNNTFFKKLHFHQCVELPKFSSDRVISFIPPDDQFQLCHYSLNIRTTPVVEVTDHDFVLEGGKLLVKVSIRTNFKLRASLTSLLVKIPIDLSMHDVDFSVMPKFRTKMGKVAYKFDEDCIVWSMTSVGGERTYTMVSQFCLQDESKRPMELGMDPPPRVTHPRFDKIKQIVDDDVVKPKSKEISLEFELPDLTFSSVKVEYLSISEDILEYTSFPWVRYKTTNDEYVYRL